MTFEAATSIITFARTSSDPGSPTRAKTSERTDGSVSEPSPPQRSSDESTSAGTSLA